MTITGKSKKEQDCKSEEVKRSTTLMDFFLLWCNSF